MKVFTLLFGFLMASASGAQPIEITYDSATKNDQIVVFHGLKAKNDSGTYRFLGATSREVARVRGSREKIFQIVTRRASNLCRSLIFEGQSFSEATNYQIDIEDRSEEMVDVADDLTTSLVTDYETSVGNGMSYMHATLWTAGKVGLWCKLTPPPAAKKSAKQDQR
jgi:hypothetical protein